jgi:hypothetical protein
MGEMTNPADLWRRQDERAAPGNRYRSAADSCERRPVTYIQPGCALTDSGPEHSFAPWRQW